MEFTQVSQGTDVFVLENGWGHSCGDHVFFSSIGEFQGERDVLTFTTVRDAMRFTCRRQARSYISSHGLEDYHLSIRELGRFELLMFLPEVLCRLYADHKIY